MENKLLYRETTGEILRVFFHVYNTLGFGFLEKVYENALALSLLKRGHRVAQQCRIEVFFEERRVGEYYADLVVDDLVVLEVKAAESVHPAHEAQLLNYLKATRFQLGLLLNFGERPDFRRRIFTNDLK